MPPLGYEKFEPLPKEKNLEAQIAAKKYFIGANMAYIAISLYAYPDDRKSLKKFFGLRTLTSEKVRYKADGVEPGQEVVAWIHREKISEPIELFTQLVTVRNDEIVNEQGAVVRAWCSNSGNLEFPEADNANLALNDRNQLYDNLDETVKLIMRTTSAGIKAVKEESVKI